MEKKVSVSACLYTMQHLRRYLCLNYTEGWRMYKVYRYSHFRLRDRKNIPKKLPADFCVQSFNTEIWGWPEKTINDFLRGKSNSDLDYYYPNPKPIIKKNDPSTATKNKKKSSSTKKKKKDSKKKSNKKEKKKKGKSKKKQSKKREADDSDDSDDEETPPPPKIVKRKVFQEQPTKEMQQLIKITEELKVCL